MWKVTKDDIHKFVTEDGELLEIIADLINGDYTVEDLRQDYFESVVREPEGE